MASDGAGGTCCGRPFQIRGTATGIKLGHRLGLRLELDGSGGGGGGDFGGGVLVLVRGRLLSGGTFVRYLSHRAVYSVYCCLSHQSATLRCLSAIFDIQAMRCFVISHLTEEINYF